MNTRYAVLYNRSLEGIFGDQARAVARELDCPCYYTDEILFWPDERIEFEKCVYFDKDVITGLRLELLGVRLYNNIGSIELCDDKRRTTELLRHDLIVPDTVTSPLLFSEDPVFQKKFAEQTGERLGFPLVAKLAFGSLGQQVQFISSPEELLSCCERWKGKPSLFQKYVGTCPGKDVRIYVVGGRAVAAMERYNPNDFRSNVGVGGHGRKIDPPEGFWQAAEDACRLLGLDFGGVDLLYGPDNEPVLCEVNSNGLFKELNAVCNISVETLIADLVRTDSQSFDFSSLL